LKLEKPGTLPCHWTKSGKKGGQTYKKTRLVVSWGCQRWAVGMPTILAKSQSLASSQATALLSSLVPLGLFFLAQGFFRQGIVFTEVGKKLEERETHG
jgi:hypothetical protein